MSQPSDGGDGDGDPGVLTEDDVEGASLKGRPVTKLKISELRFWLECRRLNSSKLKTKAQLIARYGRKISTIAVGIPHVILGVVLAVVPGFYTLAVLRFFHGVLASGKTTLSFMIAMEYCGKSKRVLVGVIYMTIWAFGYMMTAGIAYYLRNWRHMLLVFAAPEILYYIFLYVYVPETPRWLYVMNRREEADSVVRKMARINKTTLPTDMDITEPVQEGAVNPFHLCKTPRLTRITLVMLFVWAANGITYYGISLNTSDLAGNPYVNFVIAGAVEIPAYLGVWLLFNLFGRIWSTSICMMVAGMSLLVTLVVPAGAPEIVTGLAMNGKLFITATFCMVYMYTPEIYPTSIRGLGLNMNNLSSKVASPMAPFVLLLAALHPSLPTIIFGGVAVIGGLILLPMPETKGQPMVQTVEEADVLLKNASTGLSCLKRKHVKPDGGAVEILMGTKNKNIMHDGGRSGVSYMKGVTEAENGISSRLITLNGAQTEC